MFIMCSSIVFPRAIHTGISRCRIIEVRFCYTQCFGLMETRTSVEINMFSRRSMFCYLRCLKNVQPESALQLYNVVF